MDLSFGSEYTTFREEVRQFIEQNKDKQPKSREPFNKEVLEWQKLLLENGYHSRTISKEYGGYGAQPDIIKSRKSLW